MTNVLTVLSGWIVLTRLTEDGSRHNIDFMLPGDILGGWHKNGTITNHSAECVTAATVCSIRRTHLEHDAAQNPSIFRKITDIQSTYQDRAFEHQVNLACRDALSRLAYVLIELFLRIRGRLPQGGNDTIFLPLTQTQIADSIGLTNVHVNRVFRTLRLEGIARFADCQLEIWDSEALIKLSGL